MKLESSFEKKLQLLSKEYLNLLNRYSYKNSEKLYYCFDYWSKLFAISYEYSIDLSNNILDLLSASIKSNGWKKRKQSKFKIIYSLLSIINIKKGLFPYGSSFNSFFGKLIIIITQLKLESVNTTINASLKNELESKARLLLNNNQYDKLIKAIPNEFFLNIINDNSLPIYYEGSMYTLISNKNNFKILFQNKRIYLKGIQHGGCYGELSKWNTEEFEIKVSDKFFHWGLGINNIQQNKFPLKNRSLRKINKIFIVGTPSFGKIDLYNSGFDNKIHQKAIDNRIWLIEKLISHKKKVYFIEHPRQNYSMPNFVSTCKMKEINDNVMSSSLFIIDYCMHSFFYKMIYQHIPFIMFFDRSWHQNYSTRYASLISFLNKEKILYYWDQDQEFINQVNSIVNSGNYFKKNNQFIIDFLEKN
tara:strand:- start:6029 stop:7279 length:1251 start_codon:yes stop_codon:yes gene_type:complete